MEFPDLGANCAEKSCNKFDFLPVKCDGCDKIFCAQHFSYSQHECPAAHKNNVQVPVCPLCGEPVPTPRNVPPDQTVGEHIDQYCKSERKPIFTNRCSFKNCKKKELIPVQCSVCKFNFCLRHRHSADHECKGPRDTQRSLIAQAAEGRKTRPNGLFTSSKPKTINLTESVQGNMTEDEALARALALSIMELDETAERNRRNQQRVPAVGATATTASGSTSSSIANKDRCQLS